MDEALLPESFKEEVAMKIGKDALKAGRAGARRRVHAERAPSHLLTAGVAGRGSRHRSKDNTEMLK